MRSNRPNRGLSDERRSPSAFVRDDRAIEGLPIRLVIALVVGVSALALMLNMLGGIGDVGDTEVTIEITEGQTIEKDDGRAEVTLEVIDENGNNVEDATIVATAGSAQLDGVADVSTGTDSHEATIQFHGDQGLRADQDMGTIELDVVPPSDSNYIDEQPNPEVLVIDD